MLARAPAGCGDRDADARDAALTDADATLDEIGADPALVAGDTNPFAEVDETPAAYGLTECGAS